MDDRSIFRAARPQPQTNKLQPQYKFGRQQPEPLAKSATTIVPVQPATPAKPVSFVTDLTKTSSNKVDSKSMASTQLSANSGQLSRSVSTNQSLPQPTYLSANPVVVHKVPTIPPKKKSKKIIKHTSIALVILFVIALAGLNVFFIVSKKPQQVQAEKSAEQSKTPVATVTPKLDPLKNVDFTIYGTKESAPFIAGGRDQYVLNSKTGEYRVDAKSIVPNDFRVLTITQNRVAVGYDKDPNGLPKTLTLLGGNFMQLPTKMGMSYINDTTTTGALVRVNTLIIIKSSGTHIPEEWKQIFESLTVLPIYE